MIKIIAAVGKNLELGKAGDLIWHLPGDLSFFKDQTTGKTIVMGRNTFNSLPKKLPLRKHIILTDRDDFNKDVKDCEVYYNFESLLDRVKNLSKHEDVFIIGGASIYSQFIEMADNLILTEIDAEDKTADVYFPEFDKSKYYTRYYGTGTDNNIKYCHIGYFKK